MIRWDRVAGLWGIAEGSKVSWRVDVCYLSMVVSGMAGLCGRTRDLISWLWWGDLFVDQGFVPVEGFGCRRREILKGWFWLVGSGVFHRNGAGNFGGGIYGSGNGNIVS